MTPTLDRPEEMMTLILTFAGLLTAFAITLALCAPKPRPVAIRDRD